MKMADKSESSTNSDTPTNQDELILAQQRKIQQEISDTIPLVGPLDQISSLESEYSTDTIYLAKIKDLSSKYKSIRRTRPDGNCFFRAFGYAYIEKLLDDKEQFSLFYDLVEKSKNSLVALGFPQFTVEDFYDTFMEVLKRINDIDDASDAKKELHNLFNEQGYSDYMVVYLRLLTSGQLQKEQIFYSFFIDGERTVADFCHQEVEPMYKESDHIHIMGACSVLLTGVRVVYMDRGGNTSVTEHNIPQDRLTPDVYLLYRPGHYDILYL
ncbi:PREDICTED: ubiquitin thioesterase otubain-like [Nicrophorus vespilloides]|uniref:Ubiquitin thioesterase n=1 Tax=Nicrophorus vespilloides TaxID=110193 RepID=A0ABM1MP61_NICVS|nr:PREDICTED: ubiquitin thioesterase otubain-like [Nicrophorus vespilloides]